MEEMNINQSEIQLIAFRLGKNEYGLDINCVQEIIRVLDTTRVPKAPYYIAGVVNLRGTVITVIDLHKRFGMAPTELTDDSRIIIIKWKETVAGIMVDAASEVTRVSKQMTEAAPNVAGGVEKEYIKGVAKVGERLLVLLDPEKVLIPDA